MICYKCPNCGKNVSQIPDSIVWGVRGPYCYDCFYEQNLPEPSVDNT